MSRPSQEQSNNLFVQLLDAFRTRRVPIKLRLASHTLAVLALTALAFIVLISIQLDQGTELLAHTVGSALQQQAAASATTLLATNDHLSLTILLDSLTRNPIVAHAIILTPDYRVIAEAGQRLADFSPQKVDNIRSFSSALVVQDMQAAHLHISLNMQQLQNPWSGVLQNLGVLATIMLLVGIATSMRVADVLTESLHNLRLWLRDPVGNAPETHRFDEVGALARQLQIRIGTTLPKVATVVETSSTEDDELLFPPLTKTRAEPTSGQTQAHPILPKAPATPTPSATQPAAPIASAPPEKSTSSLHDLHFDSLPSVAVPCAVLSIQLAAQQELKQLPHDRLARLLTRYSDGLAEAVRLYRGTAHSLDDGSSLVLFHTRQIGEDYLSRALCCGQLMRLLGHALQMEIIEKGIPLQLGLGLSQGEDLHEFSLSDLLLQPVTQRALALGRHSRNLLLYNSTPVHEAQLRAFAQLRHIAMPPGAGYIESLNEPLGERTTQQLNRLLYGRGAATPTAVRQPTPQAVNVTPR